LKKKIKKAKEESIEEKILLFFKLRKELEEDHTEHGDKNNRMLA